MRKMKELLIQERGMITLEVSVLIPVMMWISCMILLFLMFLLDMSVAKSESERICSELAYAVKRGSDPVDGTFSLQRWFDKTQKTDVPEARNRLKRRLRERLCVARIRQVSIEVEEEEACVYIALGLPIRLPAVSGSRGGWSFKADSRTLPDIRQMLALEEEKKKEEMRQ